MNKDEAILKKRSLKKFDHAEIELKWQHVWEESGIYQPDLKNAKSPFYNLMMFPYPSAEGLHMGSVFTFTGVDVYGRFQRMRGNEVFEPIGLDGFGIHSENHAIKTGKHPMDHAKTTEDNFYRQLHMIGNGFDWKHKVETYDPHYYKWTQWLFVKLFKAGLAYKKKSPVNFCPSCKTVLADEQVIDGECERCGFSVEKQELEQWFFRITKYADRLLANIPDLNWTEKVKIAQRNWIGKKVGISISYKVIGSSYNVSVFTTRPETNFGATFIALAPEHDLVNKIVKGEINSGNKAEISVYVTKAKQKSEQERQSEGKVKTGVFTGLYAFNPLTGLNMPIWVSDFVLSNFGTGALVGVPGHDKRDYEFAKKFGLAIKRVVVGKDNDKSEIDKSEKVYEGEGVMVNSQFLNDLSTIEAFEKIMDYIENKNFGKRETAYHLRDWLISRQRYWGPPIPMIYCEFCAHEGKSWFNFKPNKDKTDKMIDKEGDWDSRGWYPVEDNDLPVKLPFIEQYKPLGTGKSPLATHPDFYETKCPGCGKDARRETDVSDTFLDSAWYFFRYLSNERDDVAFDKDVIKKWLPVSIYIGGAEHSVLHLLYARFITMVLYDFNYISFEEPFARFYAHGLIIKDGAKMSKSKGNVINPDEYLKKYGIDAVRMYLHFLGPFDMGGDFRDSGIEGMYRFLKRLWILFQKPIEKSFPEDKLKENRLRMMHKAIRDITRDLEQLRYNTAIAKLMSYYNFLVKQDYISIDEASVYLRLLAPFAPFLTEEVWMKLGLRDSCLSSIHQSSWPIYNDEFIQEGQVVVPVQINGRLRETLILSRGVLSDEKSVELMAKKNNKIAKFLEGKAIKKVIYIKGKVINFVIK